MGQAATFAVSNGEEPGASGLLIYYYTARHAAV